MKKTDEIIVNLTQELRRGSLVLSVLCQMRENSYGYSLVQALSKKGLEIDQSTLYPLLRRLEKQELLDSSWSIDENRPRRYYKLNQEGKDVLEALMKEWKSMNAIINELYNENEGSEKI
jgi:PadR family transcriptional regulator PadR